MLPIRTPYVFAMAGSLALLAGCSGAQGTASGTQTGSAGITAALLTPVTGLSFYTTMQCGAKAAAAELGVSLTLATSKDYTVPVQTTALQGLTAQKRDGLLFVPVDPVAMSGQLKRVIDSGTKVVTVDTGPMVPPIESSTVVASGEEGGALAAKAMADKIGGSGTVLLVSIDPTVNALEDRVKGFTEFMKTNHPNVVVLPTQYAGTDSNKAAQITSATILSHPDLAGVFATAEADAVGVASGVRSSGKTGKVAVVSYDTSPSEVKDLKAGAYDALVAQDPYTEGSESMKALVSVIKGQEVKSVTKIPLKLVTAGNVDEPDVAKYLYVDACK